MNTFEDMLDDDENLTLTMISDYVTAYTELFSMEYKAVQDPLNKDNIEAVEDFREVLKTELGIKIDVDIVQCMRNVLKVMQNVSDREAGFLSEIDNAEISINSKYYRELADQNIDAKLDADTVYQVMCYSPGFMARRINRLDSGGKKNKKLLDEKCREFIALKRKAHDLIKSEGKTRKSGIKDIMSRLRDIRFMIYQHDMLENLPPSVLHSFISSIEAREIHEASDFVPAVEEPQNITVGSIHYDYEVDNKDALDFLTENYDFILDEDNSEKFCLPYTIAMNENLALCYRYDGSSSDSAQQDMQNLCMSIFLAAPPNKIRFCFIDPLRMGHSFAVFNNFEDNNASNVNVIMSGRTLTEKEDIERQLRILVGTINTMVSMTFRGEYQNIREYNDANPLAPQPYHIIGIMDFPAGFTQNSLDLLEKIITEGRRCGIYVIIMANQAQFTSIAQSLREKINAMLIKCTCFNYQSKQGGYIAEGDKSGTVYRINPPIQTTEILKIAPVMKQAIKAAERITIEYENISPSKDSYLKSTIDDGISIPIGLSSSRDILSLELGKPRSQSVHALICGQIGSGKSKLLHAVITGALLKYPKEELEIYLIDFKSGTEFKIYADYNLPNLKVVALESEPEFGLSVLRALRDEKERRAQAFNANSVEDLPAYNKTYDAVNGARLPRIMIVIDEFHVLFSGPDTSIRNEAVMLLDDILRLDRNVGFHVILCSQSIRGMNALNAAALAQIAVRIALKCPAEDAKIVLGSEASAIDQIEENDAGSAVYVPAISSPRSVKFRVGLLRREKQAEILQELDKYYSDRGITADTKILASNVYDNRNSVFQQYWLHNEINAQNRVLHIGEPLKVKSSLEVRFNTMLANNLLLLGKNPQKAQNILFFAVLDLILQKVKQLREGQLLNRIFVVNYCDGADMGFNDSLKVLASQVPSLVNYYSASNAKDGINAVYENFSDKSTGMPDDWLIMSNMILSPELQGGSIYGSHRETVNRFKEILHDGPERGVFTVAWCDDPVLYRAKFSDTYEDFGKRVVFNVSQEDALAVANVVNDESINKNNAYLHQTGRGSEKFRPYAAPAEKWLMSLIDKLNKEQHNQ